jgi:hypothetical protein
MLAINPPMMTPSKMCFGTIKRANLWARIHPLIVVIKSDSSLLIAAKVIEVLSLEYLKENACDRNHSYQ